MKHRIASGGKTLPTAVQHMKTIILAGGSGKCLYPSTLDLQASPPSLRYADDLLLLVDDHACRHSRRSDYFTPLDTPRFEQLIGLRDHFGFIMGQEFVGDGSVALVLGDNIFYGHDFTAPCGRCRPATNRRDGTWLQGLRPCRVRRSRDRSRRDHPFDRREAYSAQVQQRRRRLYFTTISCRISLRIWHPQSEARSRL